MFSSAPAAALTFAAAVRPSLTNPAAAAVALSGVGMAVAMLLAALSFRRPSLDAERSRVEIPTADLTASVAPRAPRAAPGRDPHRAKTVV